MRALGAFRARVDARLPEDPAMNAPFPTPRRRASRPLPLLLPLCVLAAGLVGPAASHAAPSGVTAQPLAVGVLPEPVRTRFKTPESAGPGTPVEDLVAVRFTVAPGGSFGWHQHGGPVWVIVEQGTLTLYDGDDPGCTGRPQVAGSAFLDSGNHVHNARNEGATPVVVLATFMLPDGGALRTDVANPGVCPF